MKNLRSRNVFNYTYSVEEFDDYDLVIAEILLELPHILLQRFPLLRLPVASWGAKKRRSAINVSPSPPRRSSLLPEERSVRKKMDFSSPRNLLPFPLCESDYRSKSSKKLTLKKKKMKKVKSPSPLPHSRNGEKPMVFKGEASSPGTPLSFSPSETDYRSKHSKRKPLKKRFEELKQVSSQISTQNLELQKIIRGVLKYREDLEAKNEALKDLKRHLEIGVGDDKTNVRNSQKEEEIEIPIRAYEPPPPPKPLIPIKHETAPLPRPTFGPKLLEKFQYPQQIYPSLPSGVVGNRGIRDFDLNFIAQESISSEFYQPPGLLDLRNRAAEARKRRHEMMMMNKDRRYDFNFIPEDPTNSSDYALDLKNKASEARKRRYEINKERRSMTSLRLHC